MYFCKYIWFILFLLILPTSVQSGDSQDDVIKLVSDNWCPYTCSHTSVDQGLLAEVVKQAFAARKMATEYTESVWIRALLDVEKGRQDVVLGMGEYYIPNYHVYEGFYILNETIFIINHGSDVVLNSGEDLKKYKIGVVAEYDYDILDHWGPYIRDHPNVMKIYMDHGTEKLLSLLFQGRIDVSLGSLGVAGMYLKKMGQLDKVDFIRDNLIDKVYVGFTKSPRGEMLTREFAKGFQAILKNGTLKKIFDTYDIEMPNYERQPVK